MEFIDLHIHLQDYTSDSATEIVKKAQKSGLKKMVCAATSCDDWQKVADFALQYSDLVIPAFGVHPWQAAKVRPDWALTIEPYLQQYPQSLIGETGLDGLKPDMDLQRQYFLAHINLAKKYNRPLEIHAVKAVNLLSEYLPLMPSKFMIHSFNGRPEHLHEILHYGGYVSFCASILKNRDIEKIVCSTPSDKILLESDGPYQALIKGEQSIPFFIPELISKIAAIRGENSENFSRQVYQNSLTFIAAD